MLGMNLLTINAQVRTTQPIEKPNTPTVSSNIPPFQQRPQVDLGIEPVVIVHGGAGDIPNSRDLGKTQGCRLAARLGYAKLLLEGGTVVDAVEEAVRSMELDEHFNAGYGSVLDVSGAVSMDVSIMDGRTLAAGAATLVNDILHPITLARRVMERSQHTFLGGAGAMEFAREQQIPIMDPPGQLVTQYAVDSLREYLDDPRDGVIEIGHEGVPGREKIYGEVGTVGAVAIDRFGNVASATSTGGMTGKLVGRIGDTPVLGSGTYADNDAGAVSTTGHGETILRFNVAGKILQRVALLNETAQVATEHVLEEMTKRLANTAGAITIGRGGQIGIHWTSWKMAWAYQRGQEVHYGIRKGDDFVDRV